MDLPTEAFSVWHVDLPGMIVAYDRCIVAQMVVSQLLVMATLVRNLSVRCKVNSSLTILMARIRFGSVPIVAKLKSVSQTRPHQRASSPLLISNRARCQPSLAVCGRDDDLARRGVTGRQLVVTVTRKRRAISIYAMDFPNTQGIPSQIP